VARRTLRPRALLIALLALGIVAASASPAAADFTFQHVFGTSGPGLLASPFGAVVSRDGDSVYIGDQGHQRVVQFGRDGSFVRAWGSLGSGPGQFMILDGLAVDAAGNVYTSECGNNRVQKFSPTGTFLAAFGKNGGDGSSGTGNGEFSCVIDVVVAPSGDLIVVDSSNNRLQVLSPSGAFLRTFGSLGSGPGQFDDPEGAATDTTGNIYVAECSNNRIQEVTSGGAFIRAWGAGGLGNGQFSCPESVSVDPQGMVWVPDEGNNRIQEFTPDGTFVAKFGKNAGDGTAGTGDGEFNEPEQIAFDCRSNAFAADYGNNRVQAFGLPGLPAPNCSPPAVTAAGPSALTTQSATLNGTLANDSQLATYHFEFGPTASYGMSTPDQSLAGSSSPAAVAAAIGSLAPRTTYHFRLVATTFSGAVASSDQTFTTPGVQAVFSKVGQSSKRWHEPRHPTSPRISRRRTPTGTTFRFSLNVAAQVRFGFSRRTAGRRVGGKCKAPGARNRHRPRCTRSVASGAFTFAGHAGLNKVRFEGRISRTRKLSPGSYRLAITATAPGAAPTSSKLAFTIVK
jgi:sugar lactone lactonase YvrE